MIFDSLSGVWAGIEKNHFITLQMLEEKEVSTDFSLSLLYLLRRKKVQNHGKHENGIQIEFCSKPTHSFHCCCSVLSSFVKKDRSFLNISFDFQLLSFLGKHSLRGFAIKFFHVELQISKEMHCPSGGDMNNIPDSGQTHSCCIPG